MNIDLNTIYRQALHVGAMAKLHPLDFVNTLEKQATITPEDARKLHEMLYENRHQHLWKIEPPVLWGE